MRLRLSSCAFRPSCTVGLCLCPSHRTLAIVSIQSATFFGSISRASASAATRPAMESILAVAVTIPCTAPIASVSMWPSRLLSSIRSRCHSWCAPRSPLAKTSLVSFFDNDVPRAFPAPQAIPPRYRFRRFFLIAVSITSTHPTRADDLIFRSRRLQSNCRMFSLNGHAGYIVITI